MTKRLRELLLAVGALGLGYEIVLQGGGRPEVMTAMISLIATAGALKVDESRKTAAKDASAASDDGRRVVKVGGKYVIVDKDGKVVDEG